MSNETIFDKILNGELPCERIYSDEICIAFKDIQPQAPVHILIIPRQRIESLQSVESSDIETLGHLLFVSKKIANSQGLESWRTIINTGKKSGQTVFHLHLHLLGGREMEWPPG